jgi:hypothetical protein
MGARGATRTDVPELDEFGRYKLTPWSSVALRAI